MNSNRRARIEELIYLHQAILDVIDRELLETSRNRGLNNKQLKRELTAIIDEHIEYMTEVNKD